MVKCPYCGYEAGVDDFKLLREPWRFRFYTVGVLECPKCRGAFNYYRGVSPGGEVSEYVIRVKPRSEAMMMSMTLKVNLHEVLSKILEAARGVEVINGTEEDLKVRVKSILRENAWSKLGVPNPRYEDRVGVGTYAKSYGRIDELYGLTIFEYKKPGTLKAKKRDEALSYNISYGFSH